MACREKPSRTSDSHVPTTNKPAKVWSFTSMSRKTTEAIPHTNIMQLVWSKQCWKFLQGNQKESGIASELRQLLVLEIEIAPIKNKWLNNSRSILNGKGKEGDFSIVVMLMLIVVDDMFSSVQCDPTKLKKYNIWINTMSRPAQKSLGNGRNRELSLSPMETIVTVVRCLYWPIEALRRPGRLAYKRAQQSWGKDVSMYISI